MDDKPLCHHTSTRANNLRPYIFVYLRKQDIYPYGRDVFEIEIQKHKDLQGPDAKVVIWSRKVDGDVNTW